MKFELLAKLLLRESMGVLECSRLVLRGICTATVAGVLAYITQYLYGSDSASAAQWGKRFHVAAVVSGVAALGA
jgi:hypothetical protein